MVVYGEGRYGCPVHGDVEPGPRRVEALRAGDFDPACPHCGQRLDWRLVEEATPLRPRTGYAASKTAQEHLALAWALQTGGAALALRYHNVYGPRMPRDTPYSGVAAVFRSALERGEPPPVFEDGGQTRDFVHVDDVATANVLAVDALTADAEPFRAYNVCSGRPRTIGQVAALLSAAAGGPDPVVTGRFRAGDVRHVVAAPQRAARELGFTAAVDPDGGIPAFAHAPLRGSARPDG